MLRNIIILILYYTTLSLSWKWKRFNINNNNIITSITKLKRTKELITSLFSMLKPIKFDNNNNDNINEYDNDNNNFLFDSNDKKNNRKGTISLVGAGPGDPNLLTLKAINVIKNANLVIADRLIPKEILDLITCELIIARKKPGCADEAQDEIYQWVEDAVLKGKNVVRLKIGDPFLFGRGGEEILEFRQKLGINPLVVPGVSSSYAAPLSAGIPLTHRGISSQVLISTGYGKNASIIDIPEYHSDRTIVLLMAVGRIHEITSNMTNIMNYPIDTPVAIIEKATTIEQRTIVGTLKNISSIAIEQQAKAPATIIIGEVVNVLNQDNNYNSFNTLNSIDNILMSSSSMIIPNTIKFTKNESMIMN
jgi:uroporphyrin-III C-methyltransferase